MNDYDYVSDTTVALLAVCVALLIAVLFWAAVFHPLLVITIVTASALGGLAYWKAQK